MIDSDVCLVFLKFAALVVGGIFAALGLLTDYRDKETGAVTRWGKIALFGIILSTAIGAGTQAVQSYRDREAKLANDAANRKSEEQTRTVLSQIRRAVYPLRSVLLTIRIVYPAAHDPLISTSLSKQGLSPTLTADGDYSVPVEFSRRSTNYPKKGLLLELFEPFISVKFWKKGADKSKDEPDLSFSLQLHEDRVLLHYEDLVINAGPIPVPDDQLLLSQNMASLEDFNDGDVQLELPLYGLETTPTLEKALSEVFQKTEIQVFTLTISSHPIEFALKPTGHSGVFEGTISKP